MKDAENNSGMPLNTWCYMSEAEKSPHPKLCQKPQRSIVTLLPSAPSSHHTKEREFRSCFSKWSMFEAPNFFSGG